MCMCRQKTCFLAAGAADLDATEVNYEALESVMCDVIKIRLLFISFLEVSFPTFISSLLLYVFL